MGYRIAARSDTGRVRERNEDRYVARQGHGTLLLAVADGVAGSAGGDIAASAAIVELADRFFAAATGRPIADRLADAVRDANTAVLRAAEASGNAGAASTLVAAAIEGRRLVVANLGDSRAYLVRDTLARQLTEDHRGDTPSSITRFVGDPRGVQPDLYLEDLGPADAVVLCSDGLTRHVSDIEIRDAALGALRVATAAPGQERNSPEAAVDTLVQLALDRGGEDNVTVVLHTIPARAPVPRPSRRALAIAVLAIAVVMLAVLLLLAGGAAIAPAPAPAATPSP